MKSYITQMNDASRQVAQDTGTVYVEFPQPIRDK